MHAREGYRQFRQLHFSSIYADATGGFDISVLYPRFVEIYRSFVSPLWKALFLLALTYRLSARIDAIGRNFRAINP